MEESWVDGLMPFLVGMGIGILAHQIWRALRGGRR